MSSSSACAATIAVTPDGSTSAESMTSRSSGSTPRARVGRKRVRTPSRWKQTVKKEHRNSGQEYVSTSKVTVSLTHAYWHTHTRTHTYHWETTHKSLPHSLSLSLSLSYHRYQLRLLITGPVAVP